MMTMRLLWIPLTVLLLGGASALGQARPDVAGREITRPDYADPHAADHASGAAAPAPVGSTMTRAQHQAFAAQVDLTPVRSLSVFDQGRAKILDTLSREYLQAIYGREQWRDQRAEDPQVSLTYDPVFTHLDLLLNRAYYVDKPMIRVEVLPLRQALVAHLPAAEQEYWLRKGRLPYTMLHDPVTSQRMQELGGNVQMHQALQQVRYAMALFEGRGQTLAMISPPPGQRVWIDLRTGLSLDPEAVNAPPLQAEARDTWQTLGQAWRAGDAGQVNALLAALAAQLPQTHPQTYPDTLVRQAEWYYNRTHRFTLGWVAYLVAALCLLLAFMVNWRWLKWLGAAALVSGFLVHTGGMVVRSMLTGRWPIHNQFESFMAVSWFAVLFALVLMVARRQWLFGAAAAALGTAALMVANTMAVPSSEVGPVAAILATSRILYIHVNIVLISYAMISLAFFISLLYLALHYLPVRSTVRIAAASVATDERDGTADVPAQARHQLLRDLDQAQLTVLQIAFYLLGVGVLLGAYWADHAWGRWWAWDPKETWALITWIVYLIAIHVRLATSVGNRGLVTAWLSVIGFLVMLWCYWGVNLLLAGLHSYA